MSKSNEHKKDFREDKFARLLLPARTAQPVARRQEAGPQKNPKKK